MISVCIPTKNAGPQFARHLRAWRGQLAREEVELVIADSGSRDSTVATAREFGSQVLAIPPEEFNHGETRNLLGRQARGDLLVFTVQDACPADDFVLLELARPLRHTPDLGAVTGRQVPHADADPFARWEVEHHHTVISRGPAWKPKHYPVPAGTYTVGSEGPALRHLPLRHRRLSGSFVRRFQGVAFDNVCSALRRTLWEQFPFARIEFGEDLEWAVRVLRAGHTLLRNPAARVHHSHNLEPYQRLRRAFVSRRASNRILELPPALPALREDEVLSGIGAYAAALAELEAQLESAPQPVRRLALPSSARHLARRALRRLSLAGPGLARRLRTNLVSDQLGGSFNAVSRLLVRFHGGLSPADARFVLWQLGMHVLGDFLGDYAYTAEAAGALPDWLEEMATGLSRGV